MDGNGVEPHDACPTYIRILYYIHHYTSIFCTQWSVYMIIHALYTSWIIRIYTGRAQPPVPGARTTDALSAIICISTHSHHSQHNLRYFWYLLMLKVSGCKDLQRQSDMILPTQSRKFTDIHRISAGWKIEILWSSWLRFSPSYKGLMRCLIKQAILGTNALKLREPSHGRGINLRSITGERIGCLAVLMPGLAMFCSNVIKSQQIMTVVFYQETTNVVSSCAPRP